MDRFLVSNGGPSDALLFPGQSQLISKPISEEHEDNMMVTIWSLYDDTSFLDVEGVDGQKQRRQMPYRVHKVDTFS